MAAASNGRPLEQARRNTGRQRRVLAPTCSRGRAGQAAPNVMAHRVHRGRRVQRAFLIEKRHWPGQEGPCSTFCGLDPSGPSGSRPDARLKTRQTPLTAPARKTFASARSRASVGCEPADQRMSGWLSDKGPASSRRRPALMTAWPTPACPRAASPSLEPLGARNRQSWLTGASAAIRYHLVRHSERGTASPPTAPDAAPQNEYRRPGPGTGWHCRIEAIVARYVAPSGPKGEFISPPCML